MEPQRICQACTIIVATRNHTSTKELDREIESVSRTFEGTFLRLDTMNIDISSEMLRSWVKEGKSLRYYVPDPVIAYIEEQEIYMDASEETKE